MSIGHVARLKLTPELLVDVLCLPEGTRLLDVNYPRSNGGQTVNLLVEHPDLKVCEDAILDASPTFERDVNGQVRFLGWGQE